MLFKDKGVYLPRPNFRHAGKIDPDVYSGHIVLLLHYILFSVRGKHNKPYQSPDAC